MRNFIRLTFFLLLISSCSSLPEEKPFDFFLSQHCMITNLEQNNLIEGTQLRIISFHKADSSFTLELPPHFAIHSNNFSNWSIGWGTGKAYFDAGVENLREIRKIDLEKGKLYFGKCARGKGFPKVGQRIVFWNRNPSDYIKTHAEPIIKPEFWPEFCGKSIGFSSIVFDENRKIWITLVNEIDSDTVQIYAAISKDLIHWEAGNNGNPVLKTSDFKDCSWGSRSGSKKSFKTPIVSEIIHYKGTYYVFMDGEDHLGKRHIGLATTSDLLGDYSISKEPILSPKATGTWNDQSVFCAKIAQRNKDFILFFDGKNESGYEQVGRAVSTDLLSWKMDKNPVLDQHKGWRSAEFTTEPNYIEVHGDTILLMAAGAKRFQESFWHQHFTHRNYFDKSGNVNDAQLGAFISFDGGKSFAPHSNNPIFVNSYIDHFENEHMGGNFERIETKSTSYIFYQAKSSFGGLHYSIFMRSRTK